MMMNTNETGRSMVEMLGVLAVIGVLTVGGISAMNFGMQAYNVSQVYSQVEETARGISDIFSWSRAYPTKGDTNFATRVVGNDVCDAYGCQVTDDEKAVEADTPWGKMTVTPETGDYFVITLDSVPKAACEQLKAYQWQNVSVRPENSDKPHKTNCNDNNDGTVVFESMI